MAKLFQTVGRSALLLALGAGVGCAAKVEEIPLGHGYVVRKMWGRAAIRSARVFGRACDTLFHGGQEVTSTCWYTISPSGRYLVFSEFGNLYLYDASVRKTRFLGRNHFRRCIEKWYEWTSPPMLRCFDVYEDNGDVFEQVIRGIGPRGRDGRDPLESIKEEGTKVTTGSKMMLWNCGWTHERDLDNLESTVTAYRPSGIRIEGVVRDVWPGSCRHFRGPAMLAVEVMSARRYRGRYVYVFAGCMSEEEADVLCNARVRINGADRVGRRHKYRDYVEVYGDAIPWYSMSHADQQMEVIAAPVESNGR